MLVKQGDKIRVVNYGHTGYKHNYSKKARDNYLRRSAGIVDKSGKKTASDKFSANHWSRKDLWNG